MFAELEACLAAAASPSQRNTEIKQKENICMQFNFLIPSSRRLLPPPSFISVFSPKCETEVIPGTHWHAQMRGDHGAAFVFYGVENTHVTTGSLSPHQDGARTHMSARLAVHSVPHLPKHSRRTQRSLC